MCNRATLDLIPLIHWLSNSNDRLLSIRKRQGEDKTKQNILGYSISPLSSLLYSLSSPFLALPVDIFARFALRKSTLHGRCVLYHFALYFACIPSSLPNSLGSLSLVVCMAFGRTPAQHAFSPHLTLSSNHVLFSSQFIYLVLLYA